jgi:hypothetical protein
MWRNLLAGAVLFLLVAGGCAWTGDQRIEDARADTILKQGADLAKERQ